MIHGQFFIPFKYKVCCDMHLNTYQVPAGTARSCSIMWLLMGLMTGSRRSTDHSSLSCCPPGSMGAQCSKFEKRPVYAFKWYFHASKFKLDSPVPNAAGITDHNHFPITPEFGEIWVKNTTNYFSVCIGGWHQGSCSSLGNQSWTALFKKLLSSPPFFFLLPLTQLF